MLLIGAFALVLVLVFGVIYFSYKDRTHVDDLFTIQFDQFMEKKNVEITVNDSVVFKGATNSKVVIHSSGNTKQNIMTIRDLDTKEVQKFDLSNKPLELIILYHNMYQVKSSDRY